MSPDPELGRQLRDAERGEAAAYTEYRFRTWLAPATTVWAGSATAGLLYLSPQVDYLWGLAHAVLALGYSWWDILTRRNAPSSRTPMPREFWLPTVGVVLAAIIVAVGIALAVVTVGDWAGVLVAIVGSYAALRAHHWSYARASDAVRERLA